MNWWSRLYFWGGCFMAGLAISGEPSGMAWIFAGAFLGSAWLGASYE